MGAWVRGRPGLSPHCLGPHRQRRRSWPWLRRLLGTCSGGAGRWPLCHSAGTHPSSLCLWTASATGTREKYRPSPPCPCPSRPTPGPAHLSPSLASGLSLPLPQHPLLQFLPLPQPVPRLSLGPFYGPGLHEPPPAPQVQLLRGERYTLMDNTDPHTWLVQGPGGETKRAPAACFCIPAPDPEAVARASE